MQDQGPKRLTYPGGFDAVLAQMEGRREPMTYGPGEALPTPGTDLTPLRTTRIGKPDKALRQSTSTYAAKARELHREFEDRPALCYLNALLIANLRRRDQPPGTAALFVELWANHADFLITELDARWLVSSITTFGDHGATEAQRITGTALNVLFNTMKLHETERLYSGSTPEVPFEGRKAEGPLALQMDAFAIVGGGLDVNMLGRIWLDAAQDPVIAPLAHHLLEALNADDRNVFRRLRLMREAREAKRSAKATPAGLATGNRPAPVNPAGVETDPAKLRWGTVTTALAPLPDLARFAAWHLQLGAARVTLCLDDADAAKARWLSRHPAVEVILCDRAHWQRHGRRPKQHQMRQVANATHVYTSSDLHWLAQIDVDEFILSDQTLAPALAATTTTTAALLLPSVERLANPEPAAPARFKTTARLAGHDSAALPDIYPTYGAHLRGGYVSHLEGKYLLRTGLKGIRLGIHQPIIDGAAISNRGPLPGALLGHAHAATWEVFKEKIDFRLAKGSYRKRETEDFRLGDMLDYLRETEGETGLRHFYEEVCTATPRLLAALEAHDMLITREMDLDAAVLAQFGDLPPEAS